MSAGFLLDTNVPSELTRSSPNPRVSTWVGAQDSVSLYLSVVSVGEFRKGFCLLPQGRRRMQLEQWLEQFLLPLFSSRILPVTQSIANRWGVLSATCQVRGTPLNTADGMIAMSITLAMSLGLIIPKLILDYVRPDPPSLSFRRR